MLKPSVSHDREDESILVKAQWFHSLSPDERLAFFCQATELIIQCNPQVLETRHAGAVPGRIQVLQRP